MDTCFHGLIVFITHNNSLLKELMTNFVKGIYIHNISQYINKHISPFFLSIYICCSVVNDIRMVYA